MPENREESLLKALAFQPISVAIDASDTDFQFYSGMSPLSLSLSLFYRMEYDLMIKIDSIVLSNSYHVTSINASVSTWNENSFIYS